MRRLSTQVSRSARREDTGAVATLVALLMSWGCCSAWPR